MFVSLMKAKDIKERYAKAAVDYDEKAFNDKYKAYKIMALWALESFKRKDAKILDLGCGTGLSSVEFFKKGFSVIGVDISKEMLKKAERYPFEKLICQDLEKPLKVENNKFDIIMLIGVMEFIRDPLFLFKQINKKLKPDGIFLVTIPQKLSKEIKVPIKSYSKEGIEPIFSKAGFNILGHKSFFGYYKQMEKGKESVRYFGYLLKKENPRKK